MKFIFAFISFFSIISINGGLISDLESVEIKNDSIPQFKNWKSYKVFKEDNVIKYTVPGESRIIEVSNFGFDLPVRSSENNYITRATCSFKVKNGWLIGFNNGEWGGALCWFNNDGTKHYMIERGNVSHILELNGKIYFTTGYDHLGYSYGKIHKLKFKNNKWSIKESKSLGGCPYQSIIYKNEILIITNKSVSICDSNLNLGIKIQNGFWSGFYPNSIAIDNDIAYFGMRRGILKLNLINENKYWLTEK